MRRRLAEGETIVVRPLFSWLAGTVYWASALALAPPFATLYAVGWGSPGIGSVVLLNAIVAVVLLAFILRVRSTRLIFAPDSITEVRYLGGRTVTPISELASVRVLQLYNGRSFETTKQIFFLDAAGRTRVRLRGQFWDASDMNRSAHAYDLPVEMVEEPVSRADLRQRYGKNLYLYERYPFATYVVGAAVALSIATPLIAQLNSVL